MLEFVGNVLNPSVQPYLFSPYIGKWNTIILVFAFVFVLKYAAFPLGNRLTILSDISKDYIWCSSSGLYIFKNIFHQPVQLFLLPKLFIDVFRATEYLPEICKPLPLQVRLNIQENDLKTFVNNLSCPPISLEYSKYLQNILVGGSVVHGYRDRGKRIHFLFRLGSWTGQLMDTVKNIFYLLLAVF